MKNTNHFSLWWVVLGLSFFAIPFAICSIIRDNETHRSTNKIIFVREDCIGCNPHSYPNAEWKQINDSTIIRVK